MLKNAFEDRYIGVNCSSEAHMIMQWNLRCKKFLIIVTIIIIIIIIIIVVVVVVVIVIASYLLCI